MRGTHEQKTHHTFGGIQSESRPCRPSAREGNQPTVGTIQSASHHHLPWKAHLLDSAESIFQDGRTKKKQEVPNVDELYQKIGKLEVENDWLKKKSEQFD